MKRHTMIGYVGMAPCRECGVESILAAVDGGACLRCQSGSADAHADPEDDGNERQWREDDVADSYEDDPEDGAR